MTISMHRLAIGTFTQFLASLSDLLDHAAASAEARKIDPSILLNARLYPNMYNLTRQVGEAIRHAVVSCGLLTGADGCRTGYSGTQGAHRDRHRLCAGFATCSDQCRGNEGGRVQVPEWLGAKIYRAIIVAYVQRAAVLFSRHDGLRHPAPLRRRSRQEGFSGNAGSISAGVITLRSRPCGQEAHPARSFRFEEPQNGAVPRSRDRPRT